MTEYEIRAQLGSNLSSNAELGLQPLFSRPFELERRYFEGGIRYSWSKFPSFVLVGATGGEIEFFERTLGLLYRYLGGEVVEAIRYRMSNRSATEFLSLGESQGQQLESCGYFFGGVAADDPILKQELMYEVILLRDPFEILSEEYRRLETVIDVGKTDYLYDQKHQERIFALFEHAWEAREKPNVLVRRVEDVLVNAKAFLTQVALFLTGHEPIVLIEDIVERFFDTVVHQSGISFGSERDAFFDRLELDDKRVFERFGYGVHKLFHSEVSGGGVLKRSN